MVTAGRRKPGVLTGRLSRSAVLMLLALGSQLGCTREFYREWANQDASEAVFEKSRDPRWRLDAFSIEPPALSRFADPYDQDFPPAPPDDPAAEALSPVPQWPDNRLIVPVEANGYITMLERWQTGASGKPRPRLDRPATFPAQQERALRPCARCTSLTILDAVSVCARGRRSRARRLLELRRLRHGPPAPGSSVAIAKRGTGPACPVRARSKRDAKSGCEFRDKARQVRRRFW